MTSEQARLLTRWKMAAQHSDPLQPLVSHSPPVLFIQAVSQSHLAFTLCQHCPHFMGNYYCYLSLKAIFCGTCNILCYYLLHVYDPLPPHPHPQHPKLCSTSRELTQFMWPKLHIQIDTGNLESQIKLALFPRGILANPSLSCSKPTFNCCTDQLFTFTEMSETTAVETG